MTQEVSPDNDCITLADKNNKIQKQWTKKNAYIYDSSHEFCSFNATDPTKQICHEDSGEN